MVRHRSGVYGAADFLSAINFAKELTSFSVF